MAESAALLVDDVFPRAPIRQWVLSFPFQLRFLFASYPVLEVSSAHAERFLHQHLPHCRCRDGRRCARAGAHGAVHSLIEYLSQHALLAEPQPPDTPYPAVLQRYLHYLRCERHLSETTVKNHRVHLIPFLESLGTPLAAPWSRSTPSQLEFVVGLMLAALLHHGF